MMILFVAHWLYNGQPMEHTFKVTSLRDCINHASAWVAINEKEPDKELAIVSFECKPVPVEAPR